MVLDLTVVITSIVLGLVSIFFGIWVAGRCGGKFCLSVKFLIVAVIIFVIEKIIEALNLLFITDLPFVMYVTNIGIIIFILLALINMKQMIDEVDQHYKRHLKEAISEKEKVPAKKKRKKAEKKVPKEEPKVIEPKKKKKEVEQKVAPKKKEKEPVVKEEKKELAEETKELVAEKILAKLLPEISKDDAKKYLADVDPPKTFHLMSGGVLKNVTDLAKALETMRDDTFYHHVGGMKNEFANWVADVIKDKKLAKRMRRAKAQSDLFIVVEARIIELQDLLKSK